MKVTSRIEKILQCPKTGEAVERSNFGALERGHYGPIQRLGAVSAPVFELTDDILTTGAGIAYPVAEGFPVLMWPDAFVAEGSSATVDLSDPKYCEAYSEMAFYNPVARRHADELEQTDGWKVVQNILAAKPDPLGFPQPHSLWIDATFDTAAEIEAYEYLAPLAGKLLLQLGGSGRHAVKFLLAGGQEAVLVTPMVGEAVYAWRLAAAAGVQDRFSCVLGVGEELPFKDNSFDGIFSAGCMHHMQLEIALPEIKRALRVGGRFSAYDPWRAPPYGFGTWLLGKREHGLLNRSQSVFCKPLTGERLGPLREVFPSFRAENHGPVLRYPLLALSKFGLELPMRQMISVGHLDDRVGKAVGLGRQWGGSMMIGGEKA